MFSTYSVHYQPITKYRFGRPATDGNLLYETCVSWSISARDHSDWYAIENGTIKNDHGKAKNSAIQGYF